MSLTSRVRHTWAARARALPIARDILARVWRRGSGGLLGRYLDEGSGRTLPLPVSLILEAVPAGPCRTVPGTPAEDGPAAFVDALPRRAPIRVSLAHAEWLDPARAPEIVGMIAARGYVPGYVGTRLAVSDPALALTLVRIASASFGGRLVLSARSAGPEGRISGHDSREDGCGLGSRTAGARSPDDATRGEAAFACTRALLSTGAAVEPALRARVIATVARDTIEAVGAVPELLAEPALRAFRLQHAAFVTPGEVDESLRLLGESDPAVFTMPVMRHPGVGAAEARRVQAALEAACRGRGVPFDVRPVVHPDVLEHYYTPGVALQGRCVYPFLHARVAIDGKAYFCPFIRVEVGDLTRSTLAQVWNGSRYVELRRRLLEHGMFPVCRRCPKVGLSGKVGPQPVSVTAGPALIPRPIPVAVEQA